MTLRKCGLLYDKLCLIYARNENIICHDESKLKIADHLKTLLGGVKGFLIKGEFVENYVKNVKNIGSKLQTSTIPPSL